MPKISAPASPFISTVNETENELSSTTMSPEIDGTNDDRSHEPVSQPVSKMRMNLAVFVTACDRHGLSGRGAAPRASALIQDLGLPRLKIHHLIDRSKVMRE